MTNTKHTPGPWSLMLGIPTNVLDSGGMRVARCDFDGDFGNSQAHANARLIAAAPDMKDANGKSINAINTVLNSHMLRDYKGPDKETIRQLLNIALCANHEALDKARGFE